MGFPWSRSNSVRKKGDSSPIDTKEKRRSYSFPRFNEKSKVKTNTNGFNGLNGTHEEAEENGPKTGVLHRAASNMMPDHSSKREEIEETLSQFASVLKASLRPLPTGGDGRYEKEPELSSGFWKDLKVFNISDMKTLKEVMQQKVSGELADDKSYMVRGYLYWLRISISLWVYMLI
ncbi:hypothetical protein ABW19_dt0202088 [Dactylella cylindrospora]|nr:hypothetical protein ABW19_dt0202088 [Dactylella cylindrospora]